MAKFTTTIVIHEFRTFDFEADNFDLAKDHVDTLISNDAYSTWAVVYETVDIVGIHRESE